LYGGSCISPEDCDADLYIGLDGGMKRRTYRPWLVIEGHRSPLSIYYPIKNMGVPSDVDDFFDLVVYVAQVLNSGAKVHIGCIGGHGRTGLLMAAVFAMAGMPDPIQYVRDNYCTKAVESQEQVDFLIKHYGVKAAKPRYGHTKTPTVDEVFPKVKVQTEERASDSRAFYAPRRGEVDSMGGTLWEHLGDEYETGLDTEDQD